MCTGKSRPSLTLPEYNTYRLTIGGKKKKVLFCGDYKGFDGVPYTMPYVQQQKELNYLNPQFGFIWLVSMSQSVSVILAEGMGIFFSGICM